MSNLIHQIVFSDNEKNFIPKNTESIEKYFSNYKIVLWNYKKVKHYILKNKDQHVLDAIDSIKPYAFKTDLARYYILYNLGGWYTDINNFFCTPPPKNEKEIIFFRDVQELTGTSWAVACGLFYAKPKHKILKTAVDMCIDNVNKKYYGGHPLSPTGPNLFGSAIASYNLPENNTYLIGDLKKTQSSGFYLNDSLFAKYKPNGLTPANSGIPGGNNYEQLWNNRDVYR